MCACGGLQANPNPNNNRTHGHIFAHPRSHRPSSTAAQRYMSQGARGCGTNNPGSRPGTIGTAAPKKNKKRAAEKFYLLRSTPAVSSYNTTGTCACSDAGSHAVCVPGVYPSATKGRKQYLVIGDSVSMGYFSALKVSTIAIILTPHCFTSTNAV